jgi:hypothetical protein
MALGTDFAPSAIMPRQAEHCSVAACFDCEQSSKSWSHQINPLGEPKSSGQLWIEEPTGIERQNSP